MSRETASKHWAQMGESTFVSGMWLLYQVHRWLGRWPFLACLYPVVLYYWATRSLARASSMEYLQRLQAAYGTLGAAPGWRQCLRHFMVFAQVILDKALAMTGRYRSENICFEGRQPLLDLIQSGRGAVVVTAHMGCIELCQCMAQQRPGLKLNILVHTKHAQRFNRLMQRLAPDSGVQLLQVTDFDAAMAMALADKVSRGEFIAIAGDRVPVHESKIVRVPFLGHAAAFPCGPYVIAALLKCPLYFMGCIHEGRGYAVTFSLLAEQVLLPRGNRQQAFERYAHGFVQQVEQLLQRAPYDWFNFFPFWQQGCAPGSAATSVSNQPSVS